MHEMLIGRFTRMTGFLPLLIGLLLVWLYMPLSAQSQDEMQPCSFMKAKNLSYYLKATENYVTTENLECFCTMIDSLKQWSYKEKGTTYIGIIDSVFGSTDGVFSEYGDGVADELFKHNFTNLCKQILGNRDSHLWSFLKDELVNEALEGTDKDTAIKKQHKMFSDKVKSSKLTSKEKTAMLALFNGIDYSS